MIGAGLPNGSSAEGLLERSVPDSAPLGVETCTESQFSYLWPPDLLDEGGPVIAGAMDYSDRVNCGGIVSDNIVPGGGVDCDEPCWWLAYTKSRQEKSLARDLFSRGVAHYLPLIERKSLTRGRTRIAEVPLFTGYVFVYGTPEARLQALVTNRTAYVQQVDDGQRLRRDLSQFARLIASDVPLTPESKLGPGRRVRIRCGNLAGMEGTVLRRNGKKRLLVSIDFLQQGASLEVEDWWLEPA